MIVRRPLTPGHAALRVPDRAGRLGHRPAWRRQRDLAGTHAGVRRAVGELPSQLAERLGAERRAARRADGQLRGGPPHAGSRSGGGAGDHQDQRAPIANGMLADNDVLCAALTAAPRVHLLGLSSDGGVHSQLEHLRAVIELAARLGTRNSSSTASPTDATPRPAPARGTWRRSSSGASTPAWAGWRAWWAATSRWTATAAGSAPSPHMTCWCTAAPRTTSSDAPRGRPRGIRPRRDRRVHHRHARRRGGTHPRRRQRAVPELPPRPHAPDRACPRRARIRRGRRGAPRLAWPRRRPAGGQTRHDDSLSAGLALSKRVHRGPAAGHARGRDLTRGQDPAARRRDREVRARHLLLQRGRRAAVARRTARARAVPARRAHLRPQAADERTRDHRRVPRGLPLRRPRVLGDQLRKRRHGRAHRRDTRDDPRGGDDRRVPRRDHRRGQSTRRRMRDHRRSRQRREHAQPRTARPAPPTRPTPYR